MSADHLLTECRNSTSSPVTDGIGAVETYQRVILNAGKDAETRNVSAVFGPCQLFTRVHF